MVFSRKDLYDLVWSDSLTALSKKYNISDNSLRMACKRMDIPLPDQGHWNKIKAGKKTRVKPFSATSDGEQQLSISLRVEGAHAIEDGLSPQLALQRSIEWDSSIDLVVKDSLINPDPLVVKARHAFTSKKEFFDKDGVRSIYSTNLHISVSEGLIGRSLLIMDTFIKAMRKRGHDFLLEKGSYKVVIVGETIDMALKESRNAVAGIEPWQTRTFKPNGTLVFEFGQGYTTTSCKDGKLQKVEQQLSKLISKLELMGEHLKNEKEKWQIWRAKMAEEERVRKELEERKKLEIKSFRRLAKDASRWKESQMMREYIDQREHDALAENNMSEEMIAWLDWARKKVDWSDPTVGSDDKWLDGIAPETIMTQNDSSRNTDVWSNQHSSYGQTEKGWPLKPWYVK
ncbi:hypothetical protein [Dyadobacter pollutisoli]|uniref:Uncharacterized protein n=1 Tax=Dyadobacter pollutisoli TaxID=2910158 RepID=A0A9E8NDH5_9BACT|nr:hypothetical protein [Dyadobacter pollutisoli]WAC12996.1 hypothetical protein ON006_03325 [Dyadobacter pollutisoli]